ncbi:hypothetical protein MKEN_01007300 [Mycena kentingensis (nom. inval.)]|nr:hypothetical protein MKEN_01007300 [Mycena kentingensis (nom. inval.)]
MDYVLESLLRHIHKQLRKVFLYDIACQWGVLLKERLLELPPLVRLKLVLNLCRFVVPKLHIKGHVYLCQLLFSLGLVPGSGNTDGEGIERLWASIAGLAASTKLSGHGARADALDAFWSFWNWVKLVGLPVLLRRRIDHTRIEAETQHDAFEAFSAGQAEHVPVWLKMVSDFEADGSKPNPYQSKTKDLQWKQNEFLAFSLEIEQQQQRFHVQKQLKKSANAGTIHLKPLRRKLNKDIRHLRTLQATYTPLVLLQLQELGISPAKTPMEDVPLLLPSSLPPSVQKSEPCANLLRLELRLRHTQCRDALAHLRNRLQIRTRLLLYKKNNARHQGAKHLRMRA